MICTVFVYCINGSATLYGNSSNENLDCKQVRKRMYRKRMVHIDSWQPSLLPTLLSQRSASFSRQRIQPDSFKRSAWPLVHIITSCLDALSSHLPWVRHLFREQTREPRELKMAFLKKGICRNYSVNHFDLITACVLKKYDSNESKINFHFKLINRFSHDNDVTSLHQRSPRIKEVFTASVGHAFCNRTAKVFNDNFFQLLFIHTRNLT